jgi:hypothetical protein
MSDPFESTHKLPFEVGGPFKWDSDFTHFRVGTVEGLWGVNGKSYMLLAILNKKPGNGHFADVLDWFENSAKRDGYSLQIIEILDKRFMDHLINKRGFQKLTDNSVQKSFIHD